MRSYNLILIIAFLIFSSCKQGNKFKPDRLNSDKELEAKIKKGVTSGQKTLDLGKIANFNWDSLLILTPYVNSDRIEKQFRINLWQTKHSGIDTRDDINQLIFFANDELVKMVEYPRYPGDFSKNKIEFIQRDKAIFEIIITTQKTAEGNYWIELKKQ
jgi:hypothetical protein